MHKTQQGPCSAKVPKLNMCRSTIVLSKTTHQMWSNPLFSQRGKAKERAVEVKFGGEGVRDPMPTKFYASENFFGMLKLLKILF